MYVQRPFYIKQVKRTHYFQIVEQVVHFTYAHQQTGIVFNCLID